AGGGRVTAALPGIAGLVGAVMAYALMLRSEEQARRFGLLAGRVASRALPPAWPPPSPSPPRGRVRRGRPDRRAGGRRRRQAAGGRRRAGLPGPHLAAADPRGHRHLPVVAAAVARDGRNADADPGGP